MDHNEFDFNADLIRPFQDFIRRLKSELGSTTSRGNPSQLSTRRGLEVEKRNFVTLYSSVDESCVDYVRDSQTFDIFFDSKLYEAPRVVLKYEEEIAEVQRSKIRKGKNY